MEQNASGIGFIGLLIWFAFIIFYFVVMWKVFVKAGQPGWAFIIPFYNIIVLLNMAKRPIWWLILYIIPIVNIIVAFIVAMDLGEAFGKSRVWGFFMLTFLSFIGYPMLAFGDAKYTAPSRA